MGRLFDAVAALCGLPPVISFEGQAAMALEFAADETEQDAYPITLSTWGDCPNFRVYRDEVLVGENGTVPFDAHCGAGVPPAIAEQPGHLHHNGAMIADWEPLIRSVLADRAAGVPVGRISARFHNALADMAVAIARHLAESSLSLGWQLSSLGWQLHCHPEDSSLQAAGGGSATAAPTDAASGQNFPIVLTGGCFQNALLADRTRADWPPLGSGCILIRRCRRATAALLWGRCCWVCKDRGPARHPIRQTHEGHPMCLGVPGKLVEVHPQDDLPMGKVEFGGILKEVCLAYTPEAQVGDYVLVHVGFAISRIDEAEAQEIFGYLEEIGSMEEGEEGFRVQGSGLDPMRIPNPEP